MSENKFTSFKKRYTSYPAFYLSFITIGLALSAIIFISIFSAAYFFLIFTVPAIFAIAMNYVIIKKRARYYLVKFTADKEKIDFQYYDFDELRNNTIYWKDLDFNYTWIRNESLITIWNKNTEIIIVYEKIADHKILFENLYNAFFQYLPKERIITRKSLFSRSSMNQAYTKANFKWFI